jgi:Tfp pilus assembly protein PilV
MQPLQIASGRSSASGSTLIELMIVLVVLFMGVTVFIGSLSSASLIQTRTAAQSRVLTEIQRSIEDIQFTQFNQIDTWNDKTFDVEGVDAQPGEASVGHVFFENVLSTSVGSKVPIRLTAKWIDNEGPCEMTLVYVHTNRGG